MSLPLLQVLVTAWIIVVGYLLARLYYLLPLSLSVAVGILLGHRFDPTSSNVRGVTGGLPTMPMTFFNMPRERVNAPLQTHNERLDWMIQYLWILNAIDLLVGGILQLAHRATPFGDGTYFRPS